MLPKRGRSIVEWTVVALPLIVATVYVSYNQTRVSPAVGELRLTPGMAIPTLLVRDGFGGSVQLAEEVGYGPAIVLLVLPQCSHCHTEMEALDTVMSIVPLATLLVISVGDSLGTATFRELYPHRRILRDVDRSLQTQFGLSSVPVAIAFSEGSVAAIGRGVGSVDEVVAFLHGGV